jgi:hypothetical protein
VRFIYGRAQMKINKSRGSAGRAIRRETHKHFLAGLCNVPRSADGPVALAGVRTSVSWGGLRRRELIYGARDGDER